MLLGFRCRSDEARPRPHVAPRNHGEQDCMSEEPRSGQGLGTVAVAHMRYLTRPPRPIACLFGC